jgi:hypothetical protein
MHPEFLMDRSACMQIAEAQAPAPAPANNNKRAWGGSDPPGRRKSLYTLKGHNCNSRPRLHHLLIN